MELTCERCSSAFDAPTFRGYCPGCVAWFRSNARFAAKKANPEPGVHAVGKFNEPGWCPRSVCDPAAERNVCGVCGSEELDPGYGFAGGYGLGSYNFCLACNTVLDFFEDAG